MCILIDNTAGKTIPQGVIEASLDQNPHGYGRLLLGAGTVTRTMDRSLAERLMADPSPAIHHCRWASVGDVGLANVHPFRIRRGWYLFQNGTICGMRRDDITDAQQIANVLRHVPDQHLKAALDQFAGKFAAINPSRGIVIRTGDWTTSDGVIYSHDGVLYPAPRREDKWDAEGLDLDLDLSDKWERRRGRWRRAADSWAADRWAADRWKRRRA